jgi:acyl-CoA thioester hydrolase
MTREPSWRDWPVAVPVRVAWGEMDAFGHVNNIVYFRYFETARIAYFEACGFMASMAGGGPGPILAHTECRFRIPVTYPAELYVATRVAEIGEDRFTMDYAVFEAETGALAAEGTGRLVCFDYETKRKTPLPAAVRHRIRELEAALPG